MHGENVDGGSERGRGSRERLLPRTDAHPTANIKTGNTWVKALLAELYDLPVVPLHGIWHGDVCDFIPEETAALGARWIAHQHFFPQPALLDWARDHQVHLITTLRHPGDVLVSLSHYAVNFANAFEVKPSFLSYLAPPEGTAAAPTLREMEEQITAYVREEFFDRLDISLQWLQSGIAYPVRYEDLWLDPVATLDALTSQIVPVSRQAIERAVALCDIALMRQLAGDDAKFYRQGGIGAWRSSLPPTIVDLLRRTDPYPARFAALGYTLDPTDPIYAMPRRHRSAQNPFHGITHFDNGVPIPPVLVGLFLSVPSAVSAPWYPVARTAPADSFFAWLNAPSDDDPEQAEEIPRLTNLIVSLYHSRSDLRETYPDAFGRDRGAVLQWYCRSAQTEYGLNDAFVAPVRERLRAWSGVADEYGVQTDVFRVTRERDARTEYLHELEDERAALRDYIAELEHERGAIRTYLGDILRERDALRDYVADIEAERGAWRTYGRELERERDALRAYANTVAAERDALRTYGGDLEGERDALRAYANDLAGERDALRAYLSEVETERAALRHHLGEYQRGNEALIQVVADQQANSARLHEKYTHLAHETARQIADRDAQMDFLLQEIADLRASITRMNALLPMRIYHRIRAIAGFEP